MKVRIERKGKTMWIRTVEPAIFPKPQVLNPGFTDEDYRSRPDLNSFEAVHTYAEGSNYSPAEAAALAHQHHGVVVE